MPIQIDRTIENNKPDIELQSKENRWAYLIDVTVPVGQNVPEKQREKVRKYLPLAAEIKTL